MTGLRPPVKVRLRLIARTYRVTVYGFPTFSLFCRILIIKRAEEKVMSTTSKTLFRKLLFWLAVEIVLNLVGLDNLADYSEFITAQTAGNRPLSSRVFLASLQSV